jgi:hypothetical protein
MGQGDSKTPVQLARHLRLECFRELVVSTPWSLLFCLYSVYGYYVEALKANALLELIA